MSDIDEQHPWRTFPENESDSVPEVELSNIEYISSLKNVIFASALTKLPKEDKLAFLHQLDMMLSYSVNSHVCGVTATLLNKGVDVNAVIVDTLAKYASYIGLSVVYAAGLSAGLTSEEVAQEMHMTPKDRDIVDSLLSLGAAKEHTSKLECRIPSEK